MCLIRSLCICLCGVLSLQSNGTSLDLFDWMLFLTPDKLSDEYWHDQEGIETVGKEAAWHIVSFGSQTKSTT